MTFAALSVKDAAPVTDKKQCPHFGICGGCAYQDKSDAAYQSFKADLVRHAFSHFKIEKKIKEPVFIPHGLRRRTTLSLYRTADSYVYGYKSRASRKIVPISECKALTPALEETTLALADILRAFAPKETQLKVELTDCENGVDVRVRGATVPNGKKITELNRQIAEAAPHLIRLTWDEEIIFGKASPFVTFADIQTGFAPGVFLQPSREGERTLQDFVTKAAGTIKNKTRIVDLFSGIGAFGLIFSARRKGAVLSVDADGEAINLLETAIRKENLSGCHQTKKRDLFRHPLSFQELKGFDLAVINPPRQGGEAQCQALARSGVKKIIMISCNPVTAARDCALLIKGGCQIETIQPVDQFPYTDHIECVITLKHTL